MKLPIRFKKLTPEAQVPTQARANDAGYDLVATTERVELTGAGSIVTYGTGLALEIPDNYVGYIFPRSSVTNNTTLSLGNSIGVIDPGYRGEIKIQFRNLSTYGIKKYKVGDRIAQLVILPRFEVDFKEAEELSDSQRGTGGFGSTNEQDKK